MIIENQANPIIDYWTRWQGGITCDATDTFWDADTLISWSHHIAEQLKQYQLSPGDIVIITLTNTIAFPLFLMACLINQCNPLLLHAQTPQPDIEHIISLTHANWIIQDEGVHASRQKTKLDKIVTTQKIATIKTMLLKTSATKVNTAHRGVILQPSSGTSGQLKICLRKPSSVIAEALNYISRIQCYQKARVRVTTPLNHAYALGFGLMSTIISHSKLTISPHFNPKKLLRQESQHLNDILAIVPSMLAPLIHLKIVTPSFSLPQILFTSGAPCNAALAKEIEHLFSVRLFTNYGTTETGAISTTYHPNQCLSGVGLPFDGVSISLRNTDTYQALNPGAGEIWIDSPANMQGYFQQPLPEQPFISTGDYGYFSSDHSLLLSGRLNEIINVSGDKIDPVKIEEIIRTFPGIQDCAVYPIRTAQGDVIISAAIQSTHPIDFINLKCFCAERMRPGMLPQHFVRVAQVPRTASGKCLKYKLPGFAQSNQEA